MASDTYTYRLLAELDSPSLPDLDLQFDVEAVYADLGTAKGHTPDDAIDTFVGLCGLPERANGIVVAVPEARSWHKRKVRISSRPVVEVLPADHEDEDPRQPPLIPSES